MEYVACQMTFGAEPTGQEVSLIVFIKNSYYTERTVGTDNQHNDISLRPDQTKMIDFNIFGLILTVQFSKFNNQN